MLTKRNFEKMSDFEQVWLCQLMKHRALYLELNSQILNSKMWSYSLEDGPKLTDEGKQFLNYCKKEQNSLFGKNKDIDYNKAYDTIVKERDRCPQDDLLGKFLYYEKMDIEEAKIVFEETKDGLKLNDNAQQLLLKDVGKKAIFEMYGPRYLSGRWVDNETTNDNAYSK